MNTIKVAGAGRLEDRVAALEEAVNYGEVILPFNLGDGGGGEPGPAGPPGPQGPPGVSNAAYTAIWRWTTSTSGDPGTGYCGINSTSATAATQVRISEMTQPGADASNGYPKIKVGDQIYLQERADATTWAKYDVTGPGTDQGAYWTFPVAFNSAGTGSLKNNADMDVSFLVQGAQAEQWLSGSGAPAGTLGNVGDWYLNTTTSDVSEKTAATTWTLRTNIQGAPGATGATGPQGPQGPTGATGSQGPAGPGVPTGGTSGQVLQKTSATDYATGWTTPPTSLPPSGAASGSLAGSYPAPTLSLTGVTAGTYGSTTRIARITLTTEGRVTGVTEVRPTAFWG